MNDNQQNLKVSQADHRIGSLNAPVILVHYGCYECIRCARVESWMKDLLKEFKGDLCYVYRHYPMTDIHPHAALASMAAEAAATAGKFWEMHNLLFENSRFLSGESIIHLADKLGIDVDSFVMDLDRTDLMDAVCRDIVGGEDNGVSDAPTIFLNNQLIEEKLDFRMLHDKIQSLSGHRSIGQASSF